MCRIAFLYGENVDLMREVVNATVKASKKDRYKEALGYGPEHGDGWGTVSFSLSERNRPKRVHYYASIDPIFEDSDGINELMTFIEGSQRTVTIIHSRYTSAGASNLFNTHPFHFSGKDFELWFVHNGTMKKESLAEALGVKPSEEISDTYLLGKLLSSGIEKLTTDSIIRQFNEASKHTKSAMNTMSVFQTVKGELYGVITSYVAKDIRENKKAIDYYKLFVLQSGDLFAVVSSTIANIVHEKFQRTEEALNMMYLLNFNEPGGEVPLEIFPME
ncbi:class II glutamine amidotransferase [Thermococcus gorgonarius]|uniref:Glutamine amidotransferase type-2 domain-containing protein n=1 Tax=Thermococcus gorgonarius TaxID=71997 RepID=A0A2Z2M4E0_THEGO|nr:class II glutamine amidotransferase [Thermococcus gorgonarius]ASJ00800.1 hypothetical protein A3K92_04545 [Thermococcus gorgonarius]